MYSKETFNTLLTLSLGLTAFNYFASKNKEKKEKEKKETEVVQVEAVKENPKEEKVGWFQSWINEAQEKEDLERLESILNCHAEDYEQTLSDIPLAETECYVPTKIDSVRSIINNKHRIIHFYDKPCLHTDKDDNIISKYFKYLDYCKSDYNENEFHRTLNYRKIVNLEPYSTCKYFKFNESYSDKVLMGDYSNISKFFYFIRYTLITVFIIGGILIVPTTMFGVLNLFKFSPESFGAGLGPLLLLPAVIYYYYKLCRIFV